MSKIAKFFRDPTLFFKDAAKNRRASVRTGTPTYVVGFSTWKQYLRKYFPDRNLTFLPREISKHEFTLVWQKKILSDRNSEMFIWGFKAPSYILDFIKKNKVKAVFVEDGFVRSVQLGASKAPPMSLCLDTRTPYFDSREPSDLEVLLNNFDFSANPAIIERSHKAIALLMESGVSKYNHAAPVDIDRIYGKKTVKRILVIGQVEDDASIQFGCNRPLTNNDVVRLAVSENPGAQVIYKPHPDVLEGHRPLQSNPAEVADIARILSEKIPMAQALSTIDHVYTITSLAGFEALLRGIHVTTLGAPFYSGWGLTDDRQATPRRARKLQLSQLFAGSYLLYPRYFDPVSGEKREFEDTVTQISNERKAAPQSSAVAEQSAWKASAQAPSVRPDFIPTLLLGNPRYKSLLSGWFDEREFLHVPSNLTEKEFRAKYQKRLNSDPYIEFYVSGDEQPSYLKSIIESGGKVTYLAEGFIRSSELDKKQSLPYSLLLDRKAPHYDARRPSDLEDILNGYDFDSDFALLERSEKLLAQLLESGISEYNHVHRVFDLQTVYGVKDRKRILVLGQVEDAVSFKLANPRGYTNNDLVKIAAMENPEAQIIFKPHPKVLSKLVSTSSNPARVKHLCQILEQDLPIAQALETIDHVYTISSLGGFEALIRGIPTTTLGLPFYAGWGLGDDRQQLTRRKRKLNVMQVFAGTYVLYPLYVDPLYRERIDPFQALSRVASERKLQESKSENLYVNNELVSPRDPTGRKTAFLLVFHPWKREFFAKVFASYRTIFLPTSISADNLDGLLNYVPDSELIIWGYKESEAISTLIKERNIKVRRVEDGFVRSLALGSEHALPASVAIDGPHLYFDATGQSELEKTLAEYDFQSDTTLLEDASECLSMILESRVSKYNHVEAKAADAIFGEKKGKRVLVIGQVEDDASIKFGCSRKILNNDLVIMARLENPDAEVFYKPHPDVLGGYREHRSDPALVECYAKVIYEPLALADALDNVDHVYTITSLAGFEALMRGIKVTAIGSPFYAGWGLTDDRQPNPRRVRKLSLLELFAGAYLLYPKYFDLVTHEPCSAKKVISDIATLRKKMDEWTRAKQMEARDLFVKDACEREIQREMGGQKFSAEQVVDSNSGIDESEPDEGGGTEFAG